MKILLIRHAESENNTQKGDMPAEVYEKLRNEDPNITEKGRIQSEKLGLYLLKKKLKLKKVYCSAMVRAMETASIVQKLLHIHVEVKVNIHEVGGVYNGKIAAPGKTRSWIKKHYPTIHLPNEITESGWFLKEVRETKEEGLQRAREVICELQKWAQEGVIADDEVVGLVTHGNFMDALVAVALDRKEDSKVKVIHSNTGLTALEFKKDGSYRLAYMNMAEHLEDDFSVLALETSKNNPIDKELENIPITDPHKLHRSISQGDNMMTQLQRIKNGVIGKKDLNTVEMEDEPADFNKNVLEKIDEVPEKVAK